jgi:PAS domain S-box-containing protein
MEETTLENTGEIGREAGLKEESSMLAHIEWAMNDAVWIFEKGDFYYSQSIKKLSGYEKKEILSLAERHLSLIAGADYARIKSELSAFRENTDKIKTVLKYRLLMKEGREIWIKEKICKRADGTVTGVLTDITDIVELKETAGELERKMKEINTAKDSFITILSHDLRAPFTSILGFAEILLNEPNLNISEKNEYLSYIYDASQNQLQLINYLLDWSRLQTGKLTVEPQRLRAQAVIYNCVSLLTGNAIRKNIEIDINADDDVFINADERLVSQAVTNLLNNAIKFSLPDSRIEIGVNNFNNTQVEFVVRDFGKGITEEDQAKLFKVENMFSTEGTAGEKGSGLGLPLVKEIVEKHGGEIWFYSQPGSGSEFHFTVPRPVNKALIVNNNPAEREFLQTIVKKALPGFSTISAESGFEAMSCIMEDKPTFVITEHDLPLMNGRQLIESVRTGNPPVKLPFFVLVKNDGPDMRFEYAGYEGVTVISKPVDIAEFTDAIREVIV